MAPAQIDHIVILVPYAHLRDPPSWVTSNFTLTPGGRYSDGKTENKLIIFEDGTYLELIAFINDNPSLRRGHPWGQAKPGFIDLALTTNPTDTFDYAALRGRIHRKNGKLGIDYALPVEGGRKRTSADGEKEKEVRWKVTLPKGEAPIGAESVSRRGEIPFWCHDITSRALRVNVSTENTTHPCGVRGIAQVTILVPDGKEDAYLDLYSSIMDTEPVQVFGTARLPLDTPVCVPGLVKPWVFVESPALDIERQRLRDRGPGIVEVALRLGIEGQVGLGRTSIDEEGVWIHFLR